MTKTIYLYGRKYEFEICKATMDYEKIVSVIETFNNILDDIYCFYKRNKRSPTPDEIKKKTDYPELISKFFVVTKQGYISPKSDLILKSISKVIEQHSLPTISDNIVGVYKITNKITNKSYIGSSTNIYKRWQQHIANARKKVEGSDGVYNFYKEFPTIADCTFEILEELPRTTTKTELLLKEKEYINKASCELYNKVIPTNASSSEEAVKIELFKSQEKIERLTKDNKHLKHENIILERKNEELLRLLNIIIPTIHDKDIEHEIMMRLIML